MKKSKLRELLALRAAPKVEKAKKPRKKKEEK